MFDALEQKWKQTEQVCDWGGRCRTLSRAGHPPLNPPKCVLCVWQADLINQLYQGKLKDYVRCLECGYESWRIDTFLDIPLVIRPYGSNTAFGSVVRIARSSCCHCLWLREMCE